METVRDRCSDIVVVHETEHWACCDFGILQRYVVGLRVRRGLLTMRLVDDLLLIENCCCRALVHRHPFHGLDRLSLSQTLPFGSYTDSAHRWTELSVAAAEVVEGI